MCVCVCVCVCVSVPQVIGVEESEGQEVPGRSVCVLLGHHSSPHLHPYLCHLHRHGTHPHCSKGQSAHCILVCVLFYLQNLLHKLKSNIIIVWLPSLKPKSIGSFIVSLGQVVEPFCQTEHTQNPDIASSDRSGQLATVQGCMQKFCKGGRGELGVF